MTLQDISTTQGTSRKLKEAGFSQFGGIRYWVRPKNGYWERYNTHTDTVEKSHEQWALIEPDRFTILFQPLMESYRAFTFSELWEILPERILCIENNKHCCFVIEMDRYSIAYIDKVKREVLMRINKYNPITQEAVAELALWAVKKGYLNPKKEE